MMKKILALLVSVSLVAGLVACSSGKEEAPSDNEGAGTESASSEGEASKGTGAEDSDTPVYALGEHVTEWIPTPESEYENIKAAGYTFAMITLTNEHAAYQSSSRAFEEYCEQLGIKAIVLDGKSDQATMTTHMENLIAQGVDGIFYAPQESRSAGLDVKAAQEAGIPVVMAGIYQDTGLAQAPFIGLNEYNGGLLVGEVAGDYFNEHFPNTEAQVCIINGPDFQPVCTDRTGGFKEGFSKKVPDAVYIEEIDGKANREDSMNVTEDFLQRHPEANVFYGFNGDAGLGALAALESAGRGTVRDGDFVISHDGSEAEAIKIADENSALKVACGNPCATNGKMAVDTLISILKGDIPIDLQTDIYASQVGLTGDDIETVQKFIAEEFYSEAVLQ